MDSRDIVLHIVKGSSDYAQNDLCKKKIQKLVYLVENFALVDLAYEYEIYFYGPYSKTLDDDLRALSRDNLIQCEKNGRSYLVSVTDQGNMALEAPDFKGDADFVLKLEKINEVLAQYATKPPYELELLTTTDFIRNLLGADASRDSIEVNVEKIKGRKFSKAKIYQAIDELDSYDRQPHHTPRVYARRQQRE